MRNAGPGLAVVALLLIGSAPGVADEARHQPNVFVDMSALTLLYPPAKLADVLKDWLRMFPEKVLFGTDAAAFGPDTGWELSAWIATNNARQALGMALSEIIRNDEVDRAGAREIATMVMRTNAGKLYNLHLR